MTVAIRSPPVLSIVSVISTIDHLCVMSSSLYCSLSLCWLDPITVSVLSFSVLIVMSGVVCLLSVEWV